MPEARALVVIGSEQYTIPDVLLNRNDGPAVIDLKPVENEKFCRLLKIARVDDKRGVRGIAARSGLSYRARLNLLQEIVL